MADVTEFREHCVDRVVAFDLAHVVKPALDVGEGREVKEIGEAGLQLPDFHVGGKIRDGDVAAGHVAGVCQPATVDGAQRRCERVARGLLRYLGNVEVLANFRSY